MVLIVAVTGMSSCESQDPAARMIERMDRAPADRRPPNWERVRTLISRPAPAVGDVAPDFTLPTLSGHETVTCSAFQGDRPLVLVFGSFT
jgi:hypothetical protein